MLAVNGFPKTRRSNWKTMFRWICNIVFSTRKWPLNIDLCRLALLFSSIKFPYSCITKYRRNDTYISKINLFSCFLLIDPHPFLFSLFFQSFTDHIVVRGSYDISNRHCLLLCIFNYEYVCLIVFRISISLDWET